MKSIQTRKHKSYTTIFITDFADETLNEAVLLKDQCGYAVIKPKREALEDYKRRYDVERKLKAAKAADRGYRFEIGGCYFTKIEDMDQCLLTLRDETAYAKGNISDFGMISPNDCLIEIVFQHKAQALMF
ncbi:hypothetical protein [Staphylococcus shinii]|uniref:hypothetical protein n=1 Tax=Staphylococcus shinii TaxID=2912228 RepID=UPI003EEF6EA2